MNLLDLFSGIGGFHLGLEQSGFEFDWIGYSEINKYANELYKRRFPDAEQLGDIKSIRSKDLPEIDIVTFGFPCQDLSIAGKRGGLQANRSSLFFEAMRIVGAKKPKYFIFENVKGLFSSNEGQDFDLILRTVADIGYDGQWQLLNTRWYLPQNRERLFFVGHIRGESRPKVFPIGEDEGIFSKEYNRRIKKPLPSITATEYKGASKQRPQNLIADYRKDEGLYQVKTHNLQQRNPNRPSKLKGQPGGSGLLSKEDGTSYCLESHNLQAVEVKPVLTPEKQDQHGDMEGSNIRRLTPKEAERLQGFPDGWTEGQSDTQRYKQLGNAVSVPVVKAIGDKLIKCFG